MTIRKRIQLGILGIIGTGIVFIFINWVVFLCLAIVCLLLLSGIFTFLFLNKIIKTRNAYKNHLIYTTQFVSNTGYRENTLRNYKIVNLGSNPARFAFFYEGISGQNWSTGTQGLDKDLEILKYFHSYIKKGGIVLLPVVAFSSVSGYLKPENDPLPYVAKFVSILDRHQANTLPRGPEARRWMNYPLLFNWKYIRYLFNDAAKDDRLAISEQMMQDLELEMDASRWIKIWKEEFHIADLNAPLSDELQEGREKSIKDLQNLIDFCLERSLKPVLIMPPMSKYLSSLLSETARETYIYSFIRDANTKKIPFLDYLDNQRWSDENLYFNSFFLNLKGRKLFTKQVLQDLKKYL